MSTGEISGFVHVQLQLKDFDILSEYQPPNTFLGRLFRHGSKFVDHDISKESCQSLLKNSEERLKSLESSNWQWFVHLFKGGEIRRHQRIIEVCTAALQGGGKQVISSKQPEEPVEEAVSLHSLEESFKVKKDKLMALLFVGKGGFQRISPERRADLEHAITFAKKVIASPGDYPGLTVKGVKESAAQAQKMLDLSIVSRSKEIAENFRNLKYNDGKFIVNVNKWFNELQFMAEAMSDFGLWDKIQESREEFRDFFYHERMEVPRQETR